MYGALGGLIVLVLWIYYSAMILLFGAEVAAEHRRRSSGEASDARRLTPAPALTPDA